MLFYLDRTVLQYVDEQELKLTDFLEDLCTARRNGRHLIFSEKHTIETLLKLPNLSDRARRTLSAVLRRLRGKLSIYRACMVYVRVVHGNKVLSKELDGHKHQILISLDMINGDELFSKTRILVENRTDGNFYTGLAKLLIAQDRAVQGLMLAYELVAGGGSQTPREYQNLKNSNYLVYCIVDADTDFPGAELGSNTAGPISIMEQNSPHPMKEALILQCYSAENLIHPSMIKSALNLTGTESWFVTLEKLAELDLWNYLALKTRKTCSDFLGGSDKNVYWASKRSSFAPPACPPPCVKDRCSIYTPLKGTTLEKVSNYLNESIEGIPHALPDHNNPNSSEWYKIRDGILSWACAGGRIS
ncbi:hypothetical protein ABEH28_07845 [Pseudomonas sp. Ps21-P2]|uniref:hypothetical protein n=1 Tax=Pseudomonas sp. Ps21-P2 TaxID=3080331 RepID=UPI00320AE30C